MNREPESFRNLLAFLLIGAFIIVVPLFVFKNIPEANKDIITYMIGQLSGMATTALGFYFVTKAGQDASDARREETNAKAFEAVTATAKAATPDAQSAADKVADAAVVEAENIK